jgi:hypothetical protein
MPPTQEKNQEKIRAGAWPKTWILVEKGLTCAL